MGKPTKLSWKVYSFGTSAPRWQLCPLVLLTLFSRLPFYTEAEDCFFAKVSSHTALKCWYTLIQVITQGTGHQESKPEGWNTQIALVYVPVCPRWSLLLQAKVITYPKNQKSSLKAGQSFPSILDVRFPLVTSLFRSESRNIPQHKTN